MNSKPASKQITLSLSETLLYGGLTLLAGYGLSFVIKTTPKPTKSEQARRTYTKKTTTLLNREAETYRLKVEASLTDQNSLLSELKFLESPTCEIERIPHLASILEVTEFPQIVTPLIGDSKYRSVYGGEGFLPEESFINENSFCLSKASFGPKFPISMAKKYLRAGPRKFIYFKPEEVRACIVTCGGLCPGLNVVIREIFNTLYYNYKVKVIYGIKFGYKGFYAYDWEELNPLKVKHIHTQGGTVLGSSRGGFDANKIIDKLVEYKINQVYCVGGDGTHRAINVLYQELAKRRLNIAVIGIPKTIDNDIAVIDKSFGFETAIEESQRAITSADVEANACEYGIGLVKLMGRSAGFIALYASLASRDVNICLVPEFQFELGGPRGLLAFIVRRLKIKHHCIIVVAEGASTAIRDAHLGAVGKDASGNVKLADVGSFLKEKIVEHCKQAGLDATLKYIDPTYMIRSVPANAYDKQMCSQLAQNAVHGAMGGWTGFTIGMVNNRTCYIPLDEVTQPANPVNIAPDDRAWQRLLASTGQPSFLNDEEDIVKEML